MRKIFAFAVLLFFVGSSNILFAQSKSKDKGEKFYSPQYQVDLYGVSSLQNETGTETLITGVDAKARQKVDSLEEMLVGGEFRYFKMNFKSPESFVYDKRWGIGLSMSFPVDNTCTDIGIGYDRLDRRGEVRGVDATWTEKQNILYFCMNYDMRIDYKGGFSLSGMKWYFLYYYPLSGEKQVTVNGVPNKDKEEPSNTKSLHLKVEFTVLRQKFGTKWAGTFFFSAGYDHLSWNVGDYYSPGAGIRMSKKNVEVVSLGVDNRFKSSGPNAGEPRVLGTVNFLPLFNIF